jgi:uncharacterized membrane protein HdeD (DUF308 family)
METLSSNWWAVVLRGVAALLFGILALAAPSAALEILVLLFGAYALLDGVLAVLSSGSRPGESRWATLFEGLLGSAIGIFALAFPDAAEAALVVLVAAWSLATGVLEIVAALRLRKHIEGEWALALSGGLSVLFGVLLLANFDLGRVVLAYLLGAYAVFFGVLLLFLGFQLRAWRTAPGRQGNAIPRPWGRVG